MQAYKLKGKIDADGNLAIAEPVKLPPGDVEVIVLQVVKPVTSDTLTEAASQMVKPKRTVECSIPILKEWLENTDPVPPDFDPEQAKWEYLKEKYKL
jgi:hypothetical protein